jgi:INO80 complex subunit B
LKKSEVARRRKNQSIQRAEKDKADTINRLLKKQASKTKRVIDETDDKETAHEKLKRLEDPHRLRYINTAKGSQLNIPTVYSMDKVFGQLTKPPAITQKCCQVEGCSRIRKYTASKSGKYVCSLEHYKLVE